MKYSASTGGFYDPIINKNIPKDSVDISQQQHRELLKGESLDQSEIVADTISRMPKLKKKDFDLEAYKIQSINQLYSVSEKFIRKHCHAWTIEAATWVLIAKNPSSQLAKSVLEWVRAVKNDVSAKQDTIEESKNKAAIDAEVINEEYLDLKYGKAGNTIPAPSIKISQLNAIQEGSLPNENPS